MAKYNNPAARLHTLIKKAKTSPALRDQLSITAWAQLLGVNENDQAALIERLAGVMKLPANIKARVELLDDEDHSLVLRWIPRISAAFKANHLAGHFHQFIDKIDGETMYGIEVCASLLSRRDPDPEVAPDKLEELRKQTVEMIELAKDDSIPPEVSQFVLKHLIAIRDAIEQYELFGSKPLKTALGEAMASAVTEPEQSLNAAAKFPGNKFWTFMAGVGVVLTVSNQALSLTEGILKLLKDPKPSVIVEVQTSTSGAASNENEKLSRDFAATIAINQDN